jgi:hypothetical protein
MMHNDNAAGDDDNDDHDIFIKKKNIFLITLTVLKIVRFVQ